MTRHPYTGVSFRHLRLLSPFALVLALALFALPASAQTAGPDETLEEIVVTGTRRTDRVVTDSLSPIDLLTADDLENQGYAEMDDLLRTTIPSYQVGRHPIDDASTLVRPAKLRGLTPDQTLVLVNGKRRHRGAVINFISDALTTGAQGPDLSVIPTAALGRVEVLRDGASAQYGSDAIAGVMNFILKDAPSGGSLDVRFGEYFDGDGAITRVSGNIGLPLGARGFVNLTGEFVDQDETRRNRLRDDVADLLEKRAITMENTDGLSEDTQIWGSPIMESALFFMNSAYEFSNAARFYTFANYAQREVEGGFFFRNPDSRSGVFTHTFDPDPMMDDDEFTRRLVGATTETAALMGDSMFSACDTHRIMPQAVRDGDGNVVLTTTNAMAEADALEDLADDPNCFSWNERFPNGFTPRFGGDVTDYSLTLGVDGELARGLRYDFSIYHGSNLVEFFMFNTVNSALGPDNPEDFYFHPGDYGQEETHVQLNFAQLLENGPLGTPLHVAFGAEYREETFEITAGDENAWSAATQDAASCQERLDALAAENNPDRMDACTTPELLLLQGFSPASNGFSGFSPNQAGEWSRDNFSLYLDLENEFSEAFTLGAALRFEDYEDFGSTIEGKLAALVHLNDQLLLRGTASTGFRAPTPGQSNVRNVTTQAILGTGALKEIGLIPATDPVAAHFGAVPLEPEESTNLTLGLGWNAPSGLSVTADLFWIEVQDRLASSDTFEVEVCDGTMGKETDAAGECSDRLHLTPAEFDGFAQNAGLREGSELSYYTNSWDTETQGLEIVASWDHDLGTLGATAYTLAASYIETEVTHRDANTINDRRDYNVSNTLPETRAVLTAQHTLNAWGLLARANYWGSWSIVDSDDFRYDCDGAEGSDCTAARITDYSAAFTFDLEASYRMEEGVTFALGGQNIFDEVPGRSPRGGGNGQLYHEYAPIDPNGAYWYARLRYEF